MPSSEGVLLLQATDSDGSVSEEVALDSPLGLLWRARGIELKPLAYNVHQGGRKSFLHPVFMKE